MTSIAATIPLPIEAFSSQLFPESLKMTQMQKVSAARHTINEKNQNPIFKEDLFGKFILEVLHGTSVRIYTWQYPTVGTPTRVRGCDRLEV